MNYPTITPRKFQPARVTQQDDIMSEPERPHGIAPTCLACFGIHWKCARCGDLLCSRHNTMLPHNLAYHGWPDALRKAIPKALCSPCNSAMHPSIVRIPRGLWEIEMDFRASKDPALVQEWWERQARVDADMIAGGRNSDSCEALYLEEVRAWGRAKRLLS